MRCHIKEQFAILLLTKQQHSSSVTPCYLFQKLYEQMATDRVPRLARSMSTFLVLVAAADACCHSMHVVLEEMACAYFGNAGVHIKSQRAHPLAIIGNQYGHD